MLPFSQHLEVLKMAAEDTKWRLNRTKSPILQSASCIFGIILILICNQSCYSQRVYYADERIETHAGANSADDQEPIVFLTVSSLAEHPHTDERRLEMNWHNVPADVEGESSIRLYNRDPNTINISEYLVSIDPYFQPDTDYHVTAVQFPRHTFNPSNLTNECLDFWIALVRQDKVDTSSCIRPFPTWMQEMRAVIGNASLMDLVLPGTHNAGSYAYYDPYDDTIFKRYLVTQEEGVFNQLVYGIRYLDLRVSYERVSGSNDRFWITHGIFRTDVPLTIVINEVKTFLNATKEIIIMDFHRFVTGFTGKRSSNRHQNLITLLENELGDYMIPVSLSSGVTLEELWQADKRLYVSYASNPDRVTSQFLFPAVRHMWGDKDNVHELFAYLNASVCSNRRRRLTSAMAQLTPTTSGAIFDTYGGLRKMAHDVNRHLSRWLRTIWWHCANIVSTDFFLGNDIIRISIEINKRRFSLRDPIRSNQTSER